MTAPLLEPHEELTQDPFVLPGGDDRDGAEPRHGAVNGHRELGEAVRAETHGLGPAAGATAGHEEVEEVTHGSRVTDAAGGHQNEPRNVTGGGRL
ncbi:hypothetical protein GCM10009755_18110 [Brevibacterium samyangense]|uniref:Uncharacterized protein n=1 Tax=Brevibacterium samyangense TaxID=366888 RepID=A0ABN2TFT1_9MICO